MSEIKQEMGKDKVFDFVANNCSYVIKNTLNHGGKRGKVKFNTTCLTSFRKLHEKEFYISARSLDVPEKSAYRYQKDVMPVMYSTLYNDAVVDTHGDVYTGSYHVIPNRRQM